MSASFVSADDFLYDLDAAITYLSRRGGDACAVATLLKWEQHDALQGVLRCKLYGLSILWDIRGGVLHAGYQPCYEFIRLSDLEQGTDPLVVGDFRQLVAYILARFW